MAMVSEPTIPGFDAQFNREIEGKHTEFVFQKFANQWFVLITQYDGIPNLYTVQFDVQRDPNLPATSMAVNNAEFHVSVPVTMTCTFGADKDEARAGIQFLINRSKLGTCPTEIFMGLGLRETNGKVLRELAAVLDETIP